MKNLILLLAMTLTTPTMAQDLDKELRKLLSDNGIKPITFKVNRVSALYKLGEKLFSDNDLSGNRNISCQTCHQPTMGGSDQLPLPIGEGGIGIGSNRKLGTGDIIPRNTPHLFNLGLDGVTKMFWDGRVSVDPVTKICTTPEKGLNGKHPDHPEYIKPLSSALSVQAMFPPLSHSEMRGQLGSNEIADATTNFKAWEMLTSRITDRIEYQSFLKKAFPSVDQSDLNFGHLGEAMGNFQAHRFIAQDTPFDRYLRGENNSLSNEAKTGAILFYSKAKCVACHSGSNFTDNEFHNVAFPQVGPGKEAGGNDRGLFLISQDEKDLYKFKTPSLRNISLSAPYGHSGSLKNLKRVVEHYSHPMRSNHHYDGGFRGLPYALDVDWTNMNDRLKMIDPILGRMGVPINADEIKSITLFLSEGLTQNNF